MKITAYLTFFIFYFSLSGISFSQLYYQGGILEFDSPVTERFSGGSGYGESIVLRNYAGLPLKALQFKIVIGEGLLFKSLSRGSSIPASSFLMDYQLHKNYKLPDNTSADVVFAVLLGMNENNLLPSEMYQIVTINYDTENIIDDSLLTGLKIYDVVGATSSPVQDANIISGQNEATILIKSKPVYEEKVYLLQNFPNPFNPSTTINFRISDNEFVNIKIYNSLGEEISTLMNEFKTAGNYSINFDGNTLSSGIYFYRLTTNSFSFVRKMILIE